ncbi:hypothetical protein [Mycolicibacterium confluentis]|uniref:Uncharacterized protein n=1 Tax=Mycolicibacterium confluentis TaxID=28047 RepID=A0A7I7Y046_9MYCO|nr:hypothetical protein [Mycolicibacterium confluentis]MCV7319501.1 hypothetical protein [Mycolicibacterium confluentis]ORV34131.1 hypothetical protein AWB99_00280 [Mycolicibacterium confluentis]BBZ34521.1 hypothetical protein MCNF_31260 [Mycolicibacterium confluentis]
MTVESAVWERARAVADAVLYEGYLLYPYRATSSKNQVRWQFGVLGPPGAADAGLGEEDHLAADFLVHGTTALRVAVRFLHLQNRRAERLDEFGGHRPVPELVTPSGTWLTWDEAVETEVWFGPIDLTASASWSQPIAAAPCIEVEVLDGGRLVRERHGVHGVVEFDVHAGTGDVERVTLTVRNTGAPPTDRQDAIERSLIGAHVLVEALDGGFVSLLEPPDDLPGAAEAVAECRQHRCFPVLAGPAGFDRLLLISPIILYDHPEIAEQSSGALYDSTEIDEILTLRVMAMTEEEKAQARATDSRAARIIDQCDGMSAEAMLDLHGVWWDPLAERSVRPDTDAVLVDGVRVACGSRVRLRPSRRADAQDMFVSGRIARVTAVHEDFDGATHVAVVMDDDPGTEVHEWYGRHLYFSPEEIEPLNS